MDTQLPSVALDGLGMRLRTVTAAYTLTVNRDLLILADATGGAFDVTLPPAAEAARHSAGQVYQVMKTDAGGNAVTLEGDAAETINGAANVALAAQYDTVSVVSDGTEWFILKAV